MSAILFHIFYILAFYLLVLYLPTLLFFCTVLFLHFFFVSTLLSIIVCILSSFKYIKNHKKKHHSLHPSLTKLHNTKTTTSKAKLCRLLASKVERTMRLRTFIHWPTIARLEVRSNAQSY